MMRCCGCCFKDRGLRQQIIPRLSDNTGDCPTCGATEVDLVDAIALGEYFESLCGIYRRAEVGRTLVDWLIDDWQLFEIERANANNLLVEILNDGERVRWSLKPSTDCESENLDHWKELRDELRGRNRFFPTTAFEHARLKELLSSLIFDDDGWQELWYRARIEKDSGPFGPDEMGAPPAKMVGHGRANPPGIPYLYLGSNRDTAIAEVRPHPGERVCVAEVSVPAGVRVVDLQNPRQLVSPFLLEDDAAIASMRGDIAFLERLGEELSTPVLPHAAAIDYIPSQYLCEFIKRCGYAGVAYSSSVTDGVNIALFAPELASIGAVSEYLVDSVDIHSVKLQMPNA